MEGPWDLKGFPPQMNITSACDFVTPWASEVMMSGQN